MTETLIAEPGRRVVFTGYGGTTIPYPGVITGIADSGALLIRLDGSRSSLHITPERLPATKSLRLLDEVGPVPELPMGRFRPTVADMSGEYAGVPVAELEEGDIVLLTADADAAHAALAAYATAMDMDLEFMAVDRLAARWVVFEWQPEGAECSWLMDIATEGGDMVLPVYYLPA